LVDFIRGDGMAFACMAGVLGAAHFFLDHLQGIRCHNRLYISHMKLAGLTEINLSISKCGDTTINPGTDLGN
jgi:hypothetical protein